MNPFLLVQAALCAGASIFELWRGNGPMCLVYAAWAVSNGALAWCGGK